MKILRRNNDFKKMPDSTINEVVAIKALVDYGWKHCSKKEYKEFFGAHKEQAEPEVPKVDPDTSVEPTKKKKHGKNK
jgi:hypothetical protein